MIHTITRFSTVSWAKHRVVFRKEIPMDITVQVSEYLGYAIVVSATLLTVTVAWLRSTKR